MTKPDYTALDFPAPPEDRPYVFLNMVTSLDGKVVVEGTEQGIGSKVDQRLMRELRVNADVVLNGANTLRITGTSSRLGDALLEEVRISRGKPRLPIAAVLSASGNLPLDRLFFTTRDFDAVVYLADTAPAGRRAAIEASGRPVVALPAEAVVEGMLRHMRQQLGANVLLVEGGPSVNGQFLRLGVVDEFFLTIGPVVVGGRGVLSPVETDTPFTRATLPRFDLVWAVPNHDTGEIYCRYRRRAG